MMTDPIADLLTQIRNANRIERPAVDVPATRMKQRVVQVLKDEGFVLDFQVGKMGANEAGQQTFQPDANATGSKAILRIYLKYGPEGERVIRKIDRASRPGLRIYRRCDQLNPVLDGLGISVLSTSKGIMSDRQARAKRLGGELLCTVW